MMLDVKRIGRNGFLVAIIGLLPPGLVACGGPIEEPIFASEMLDTAPSRHRLAAVSSTAAAPVGSHTSASSESSCIVSYEDVDQSFSVSAGDVLTWAPSAALPGSISLADIALSRRGDDLGKDANLAVTPGKPARLVLGAEPVLRIGDSYPNSGDGSTLRVPASGLKCQITDSRIAQLVPTFDREWAKRREVMRKWSTGNNAFDYYNLSTYLEGLTSMYEATGQQRYLDSVFEHAEAMMASGRDKDGNGYFDYRSTAGSIDRDNVALYEWRGFRPLARLMRLVGSDDRLREHYAERYDALRYFVEHHVIEKWSKEGAKGRKLDFFEDDGLIHRLSHMGDILVDAAMLDDTPLARRRVCGVASRVANQIKRSKGHKGALEWNILFANKGDIIRKYDSLLGVSDTSHASGTVSFVAADAALTGCEFDANWSRQFAKTLLDVIWDGNIDTPAFSDYVDGGTSEDKPNTMGLRNLSDGWVKLGMFDRDVQRIMVAVQEKNLQRDKEIQLIGNLARNFAFARWQ